MRTLFLAALAAVLCLLVAATPAGGQSESDLKKVKSAKSKEAPDEFRALLKEVEEAYKAPLEVDEDVLDELRKQYRNPTPERELKIFKEIRRLYFTTPAQEEVILRELRLAYANPTAEQEARVFQEVRRGGPLPLGTIPVSIQAERAGKLFRKLDRDGDGQLGPDELPALLSDQRARWDANGDGRIGPEEYGPYYQGQLKWVSDGVASGEIPLKLPKGLALPEPPAPPAEGSRPVVVRAGNLPSNLPAWFADYDADGDGQVGLYEWKKAGKALAEFAAMDGNTDGFLEAKELLAYLAAKERPGGTSQR